MDKTLILYYTDEDGNEKTFPKDDIQAEITAFTYSAQRMGGAPTINASFMYHKCLDNEWNETVYTIFRGEKYYLKQTPSSSYSNDDTRYKHSLEIVSERSKLDTVYFFDTVIGNTSVDRPVSNSTKLVFHGDINQFAKRLNYSLVYTNMQQVDEGGNYISGYRVIVDKGIKSKEVLMSFENQFITNVLQEIYNKYELPYYFDGKDIHIGFNYIPEYTEGDEDPLKEPFEYGADNALMTISKNNANNKIVTRCSGVGSTENIQYYYPNETPKGKAHIFSNGVEDVNHEKYRIKDALLLENFSENYKFKFHFEPEDKFSLSYYRCPFKSDPYSHPTNTAEYEVVNESVWKEYPGYNVMWVYENVFDLEEDYDHLVLNVIPSGYNWMYNSDLTIYYNNNTQKQKYSRMDFVSNAYEPMASDNSYRDINISDFKKGKVHVVFRTLLQERPSSGGPDIFFSFLFINAERKYWTNEYTSENIDKFAELSNQGLEQKYGIEAINPQDGDIMRIEFDDRSVPSSTIVAPIYRNTIGQERFYNAKNYPFDYVDGYELEPLEYETNGKVHNDAFKNPETGKYYVFDNEYNPNSPREHIINNPDIKPTITGITQGYAGLGQLNIDMFSEFAYDLDDNDERIYDAKGNELDYQHLYFYGKLRKMPFNLFDYVVRGGETVKFSMTSGVCGACSFELMVDEESKKNTLQVGWKKGISHILYNSDGTAKFGAAQDRQNNTKENEVWVALKKETATFGTIMPNQAIKPKGAGSTNQGDTFVVLGIAFPQYYIDRAEKELEREIIKYMYLNNSEKFTFSIKFSRIFFAEHPEYLNVLNENVRIKIKYNEAIHNLYVMSYSYRMINNEPLPEITVELKDEITVSQTALQEAVSTIEHDIMSGIGSIDWLRYGREYFLRKDVEDTAMAGINFQTRASFGIWEEGTSGGMIDSSGHEEIESANIRKELSVGKGADDYNFKVDNNGNVTTNTIKSKNDAFEVNDIGNAKFSTIVATKDGGIMSDNLQLGTNGHGFALMKSDIYGHSYLEVDKLLVRLKAIFTELQIHSIKYSGGSFVFSPAGMTVSHVALVNANTGAIQADGDELSDSDGEIITAQDVGNLVYRCYFTAKDGERVVVNEFAVGDLVRTQEFNIKKGTSDTVSNNICWRECVYVGNDYIDLWYGDDKTDPNEEHHARGINGYPKIGDDIVTFGNKSNKARQNIIYMNSYGGSDYGLDEAPCIIQYAGVNSFSLEGKIVTKISPDGNIFTGKDFIVETESGEKRNLFSMAQNGIVLSTQANGVATQAQKDATQAQKVANEAILKMTPQNISLALINNNPIINYFDNGNFENDYIVHTGVGSIVKYNDAKFGSRCFNVNVTGWVFTLGSAKVEKGTYTFIFSLKIPTDTSGTITDIFKLQFCKDSLWESNINDITFDNITLPSDGSWITYKWVMRFTNAGYIRFACSGQGYGTLYLDGLMLLKGDYSGSDITNYVDYYSTSQSETNDNLLKTGIDIKERKITLTADQFEVKNNNGETTATINEEGVLEMNSGVFKGRLSLPFRQLIVDGSEDAEEQNEANGFEKSWDGGDYAIYRIKDLNKGANVCIIGGINQYVRDVIELPVQPEYNGTLVTIIKERGLKAITITTNESELSDKLYDKLGYGFISHGNSGTNILMEGSLDYEVLELMAVKITKDFTSDDASWEGVCAWMILNQDKFIHKDKWEINGGYEYYDGYVSRGPEELLENKIKALESNFENRIKALENKLAN